MAVRLVQASGRSMSEWRVVRYLRGSILPEDHRTGDGPFVIVLYRVIAVHVVYKVRDLQLNSKRKVRYRLS